MAAATGALSVLPTTVIWLDWIYSITNKFVERFAEVTDKHREIQITT